MDANITNNLIPICAEVGNKRLFAAALDWPGWCRSGKDEATALANLLGYAPPYSKVLQSVGFQYLTHPSNLLRLHGAMAIPQQKIVPSSEPEISSLPSGVNASRWTCW